MTLLQRIGEVSHAEHHTGLGQQVSTPLATARIYCHHPDNVV